MFPAVYNRTVSGSGSICPCSADVDIIQRSSFSTLLVLQHFAAPPTAAAGAELDVDGRAHPTPPGHTSASAGGTSGTPGHTSFWNRQPRNPLGPGPSPVKARSPGGGMELLFNDDYDEYDADVTESNITSDDEDVSDLFGGEDDDDDDDELDSEVEVGTYGVVEVHGEDDQPADEDDPEVQEEEDDELFGEPVVLPAAAASSGGRGASSGAAAGASSGGSSGRRTQRGGSRGTKSVAVKRLSDLGVQEHPYLRSK